MLNCTITEQHLTLKYTWKISRNESDFKTNFIVHVGDEKYSGRGEVAPNIRYGESPDNIKEQFTEFLKAGTPALKDISLLQNSLDRMQLCSALRFGIESAYIHYLCDSTGKSVSEFFKLVPAVSVATAYTLPIMDPGKIKEFYKKNSLSRFQWLKLKVGVDDALEIIKEASRHSTQPFMIDANEAWKDVEALCGFLGKIKKYRILFIEQPLPAGLNDEYAYLKKNSPFELMADESVLAEPDFGLLKQQFHGVNMKLMKAGGYLNGIRILTEAKRHDLKTMIGCMVETTLGISSALHLSSGVEYIDLDSFLIIKDEPFKMVKEEKGMIEVIHRS